MLATYVLPAQKIWDVNPLLWSDLVGSHEEGPPNLALVAAGCGNYYSAFRLERDDTATRVPHMLRYVRDAAYLGKMLLEKRMNRSHSVFVQEVPAR